MSECLYHEVHLGSVFLRKADLVAAIQNAKSDIDVDRPAAAVIPAPIAYIKVVAVKKLVVEVWSRTLGLLNCMYLTVRDFLLGERPPSGGPEPGLLL